MFEHKSVIIIGAGAAGLMCAATAGRRDRDVLVLDHANKPGKKILMSGGGRCNFTNLDVSAENYICANPHFCKSALSRYTPWHFLELINQHQIPYHEKAEGQLFCDNKASDILNMLLAECERGRVQISMNSTIEAVAKTDTGFTLQTSSGNYHCNSLVIATGGLSIPTMGATGFGYQIAEQFGLEVLPRQASLVPLTVTGSLKEATESLAGVSLPATVSSQRKSFSGDLLFTHRGISGPVVLQISNYWEPGEGLSLSFLPGTDLSAYIAEQREKNGRQSLKTVLGLLLPKRFLSVWLAAFDIEKPLAEISKKHITDIVARLQHFDFNPAGTEGYRTAEVTRGGVNTDAISSKTFAVKNHPGLYFIGEVLDVTGWLGGYNFQWAWASAVCAGEVV